MWIAKFENVFEETITKSELSDEKGNWFTKGNKKEK